MWIFLYDDPPPSSALPYVWGIVCGVGLGGFVRGGTSKPSHLSKTWIIEMGDIQFLLQAKGAWETFRIFLGFFHKNVI